VEASGDRGGFTRLVAVFIYIPFVSDYAFWFVIAGFFFMLVGR
jgi:hypothetical protein